MTWSHRCHRCGTSHTWSAWLGLRRLGLEVLPPVPGDGAAVHEYRLCGCHNTLVTDLLAVAKRRRARMRDGGWRRVSV